MKVTEKQLKGVIKEAVKNVLMEGDEPFDPYNYSFDGGSDDEFNSFYEDEDQADMEKELIDLVSDGENLFRKMREVIETSKYYTKQKDSEVVKKYIEKIDAITDTLQNFWS